MSAKQILANADRNAVISECGKFRYWLGRRWDDGPTLLFVMLNPSTADANVDDATIRRCVTFAHAEGFRSIEVVNLFAYRATKPVDLRLAGWPAGELNDGHISAASSVADGICVAWGAIGERNPAEARVQVVMPIFRRAGRVPVQCLRITRSGYPQHPLMLPSDCRLSPFEPEAVEAAMAQE